MFMPRESDPDHWLEEAFPKGDGTAETATTVVCPYCGESTEIAVDPGGGGRQEYVEDCPVCCRPWTVRVRYDDAGRVIVDLEPAA
jgi:hypothetical protein